MATVLKDLLIPGGRFIMGDLMRKGDKDTKGQPIPADKQRYFFGVAVPKTAPGLNELIGQLWQLAATDYQNVPLVMQQVNQGLSARDFSWKIEDGDAPVYDKTTGQLKQQSEYSKGCMIFKFGTQFEIGACNIEGRDIGRDAIKRGDYVDVMFDSQINGNNDHTAGIYLNPKAIRLLGYGEAITAGLPASAAFAGKAAHVPVGASAMPTAAGMGLPPVGGAPAPQQGMPQPGYGAAPAQPQGGYAPAPQGMPQPTPGYGAAPPVGGTGGMMPQPTPGYGAAPPVGGTGGMMPQPGYGAAPAQPQGGYAPAPQGMPQPGFPQPGAPAGMPMGHAGAVPAGVPGGIASPGSYPGILNPSGV